MKGVPDEAVCQGCGYPLRGLPNPICPECGRGYDPDDPQTFAIGFHLRWWSKRWTVLPPCLILFGICFSCILVSLPPHDLLDFLGGPLNRWGYAFPIIRPFIIMGCFALMVSHPVKPCKRTAILTPLGFVLWTASGAFFAWVAYWAI